MLSQYLKEISPFGDWITASHKSFFHFQLAQHSLDPLIADVLSIGDSLIVNFYSKKNYEYDMPKWYQHAVLFKIGTCADRNITYCHFMRDSFPDMAFSTLNSYLSSGFSIILLILIISCKALAVSNLPRNIFPTFFGRFGGSVFVEFLSSSLAKTAAHWSQGGPSPIVQHAGSLCSPFALFLSLLRVQNHFLYLLLWGC